MESIKDRKVEKNLRLALIFYITTHFSGTNFVTMFFNDVFDRTEKPYLYRILNLAIGFVCKFSVGISVILMP
jgi:hypothetical protein